MSKVKQHKLIQAIVSQNAKEVQDALSQKGIDVNHYDSKGVTPLVKAINIGDSPEIAKLLIDAGAYPGRPVGPDATVPILLAAFQNRSAIFKVLAEEVDPVLAVNKSKWTCLIAAAHSGSADIVKFILDSDPTKEFLDAKNILGRTALHEAVIGKHKEVFDLLLKKKKPKIEIDEQDNNQATPLLLAASLGNIPMCKSLISKGADMTLVHKTGGNILHYAAAGGHKDVLEFLLKQEKCPSIDAVNNDRVTPLLMAVSYGHSDAVKALLSHKAEPNIAEERAGLSPLHIAARYHYEDIVKFLITSGADPLVCDTRGQTPIDHAMKKIPPPTPKAEPEPENKDEKEVVVITIQNIQDDSIMKISKPLIVTTPRAHGGGGVAATASASSTSNSSGTSAGGGGGGGQQSPRTAGRNKAIIDLLEKEMTTKGNKYHGAVKKRSSGSKSGSKSKSTGSGGENTKTGGGGGASTGNKRASVSQGKGANDKVENKQRTKTYPTARPK